MSPKNKYSFRSRISEAKIRQIVRLLAVDLDASQTAVATRLNRNTINRYLAAIRERLVRCREAESPASGGVGVDEGCFGPRRVKGARGRGDRGKTTVSGLFGRNGRVYAEIARLLRGDASGDYSWPCRARERSPFRWPAWLRWSGRAGMPETLPGGTQQQRVCRQAFSHQWDRKLPGLQNTDRTLPGATQAYLLFPFERMRISL